MAGRAGTPRFGDYGGEHESKPNAQGQDTLDLQSGDGFEEQHFLYDPTQRSRQMGTTLGDAPQKMAGYQKHQYEAMCNHDGFEGGDAHLISLDERKVLDNTIFSVDCVYADDFQHNFDSSERS